MLLKRIAAFLLALLLIFNPMCMRPAYAADQPATPTDLYEEIVEFEDDDFGFIDPDLIERKVYLDFLQTPQYYGDTAILVAVLVDFRPEDNPTFEWQYSLDCEEWITIENEIKQTYEFVVTYLNSNWYYRVIVKI